MRITINPVLDMDTLQWTSNAGVYDYVGPVDLCCSSGGQISATDEALQKSQAAMTDTLNKDYGVTFAEQQSILGQMKSRMDFMASNPMGYSASALHSAKTSINENTATAAHQALGKAAAFAAAHGASDVGGGAIGEISGEIASEAAQSKASQLSALNQQNEDLKQQNFWRSISALNSVGSEVGGAGGTAISGAGSSANSSVNAGSGALAAKNAGWEHFTGTLGAISGLAKAGAGIATGLPLGGGGGGGVTQGPLADGTIDY